MQNAEMWLRLILRLNAVLLVSAFPASLLPSDWMATIHERMGLGEFPQGPLVGYLTRTISTIYGGYGVLTFLIASDIQRYRPLVTFWGAASAGYGVAFFVIDLAEQMPLPWTLAEGSYLVVLGVAVLWLQNNGTVSRPRSATSPDVSS